MKIRVIHLRGTVLLAILVLFLLLSFNALATQVIEAEFGKLKAKMELSENNETIYSSRRYKGLATYQLYIPSSGKYRLEFKTYNPTKDDYKLKVQIKKRNYELRYNDELSKMPAWQVAKKSGIEVDLNKGKEQLVIRSIDEFTYIDAFRIIPLKIDSSEKESSDQEGGMDLGDIPIYAPSQPRRGPKDDPRFSLLNNLIGFASGTTGGLEGPDCKVTNLNDDGSGSLRDCAESNSSRWVVFEVSGTIALKSPIKIGANTTIDGRGQNIRIINYGLVISKTENVIIHNVSVSKAEDDAITVYKSKNVWVDHVSLSDSGDGLLDITEQSSAVTVSYSRFEDHIKAMLIGANNKREDDQNIHVTIHNNLFYNTVRRNPAIRFARVHLFNNVFKDWGDGTSGDGVSATYYSQVYLEKNIFDPDREVDRALRLTVGNYIKVKGYVKATGNLALGEAKIFSHEEEKVFLPSQVYNYSAQNADDELYQAILSQAGRAEIPTWDMAEGMEPVLEPIEDDEEDGSGNWSGSKSEKTCDIPCTLSAEDFSFVGFLSDDDGSFYSPTSLFKVNDENPLATTHFYLEDASDYKLEITHYSPTGKEDSLFLKINDGPIQVVHLGFSEDLRIKTLNNRNLVEGRNEITVFGREKNTKIYQIRVVN